MFELPILVNKKCDKILERHLIHSSSCSVLLMRCFSCAVVDPILVICWRSTKDFLYLFSQPILMMMMMMMNIMIILLYNEDPYASHDLTSQREWRTKYRGPKASNKKQATDNAIKVNWLNSAYHPIYRRISSPNSQQPSRLVKKLK